MSTKRKFSTSKKRKVSASSILSRIVKAAAAPRAKARVAPRAMPRGMSTHVTGEATPWHKGLASEAGSLIGGYFGGPVGASVGRHAGDMFSRVTGFGDYKVRANSLVGMGTDPPVFKSNPRTRNTIIRHREFIADITGTTSFTNTSYPINPGLVASLPWGSQIAANFEQYRVRGMVFEFKTTSATAIVSGTNSAMGTVIMCTEYNSLNPGFTSKSAMENHEFCTSSIPSNSFLHPVECARHSTTIENLYIRTGAVPSGADQRMYDLGVFQIATVGMQGSNTIGELWVTYEIELIKPVLFESAGYESLADHYTLGVANVSTSAYLGTSASPPVKSASSNLGTTLTLGTSQINFPSTMDGIPQTYGVAYSLVDGSTNTTTFTTQMAATSSNGTFVLIWNDGTGDYMRPSAGTTGKAVQFLFFIDFPAGVAAPALQISAGTVQAQLSFGDLFVFTFSPLLISALKRPLSLPPEAKEEKKDDSELDAEFEAVLAELRRRRSGATGGAGVGHSSVVADPPATSSSSSSSSSSSLSALLSADTVGRARPVTPPPGSALIRSDASLVSRMAARFAP